MVTACHSSQIAVYGCHQQGSKRAFQHSKADIEGVLDPCAHKARKLSRDATGFRRHLIAIQTIPCRSLDIASRNPARLKEKEIQWTWRGSKGWGPLKERTWPIVTLPNFLHGSTCVAIPTQKPWIHKKPSSSGKLDGKRGNKSSCRPFSLDTSHQEASGNGPRTALSAFLTSQQAILPATSSTAHLSSPNSSDLRPVPSCWPLVVES